MAQLFDPRYQAVDANGLPYAGAQLTFYQAGTTTKITIYQDADGTTPHTNPVIADSSGTFPPIFLDQTDPYKFVLQTADGVTVSTVETVPTSVTRLQLTEALRAGIPLTPYDFDPLCAGDGIRDDTQAVSDLITAAQDVIATDSSTLAQLPHAVDLGIGRYKITAPLPLLEYGLEFRGRGQSLSRLIAHGAFALIETKEFQSDGTTPNYMGGMVLRDFAIHNGDAANPSTGMKLRSLIRNCYAERVAMKGLEIGFDVDRSWTLNLRDCWGLGVSGQTDNHILLRSLCGAIIIDGGRYDVGDDHLLKMDAPGSDLLELVVTRDAAFQFGIKSGIHIDGGRTAIIESAFLEGNCIGSPSEYHLYLKGSGSTLSHAVVKEITLNNLADSNRDGSGVFFADNYETVEYHERWNRNGVSVVPAFGTGVTRALVNVHSATTIDATQLGFFAGNANATAHITQPARPDKFFGKVMESGNIGDNGAADFGRPGEGSVLLGTWNGEGAIQAHTGIAGDRLEINPRGGELVLPSRVNRATATSSNWTPTSGIGTAFIDTSGASRSVLLDGLSWTPSTGQRFEVWKVSASNNLFFVPPSPTDTINGAAGTKTVTSSGLYIIEKRSETQWLLTHQALA